MTQTLIVEAVALRLKMLESRSRTALADATGQPEDAPGLSPHQELAAAHEQTMRQLGADG